MQWLTYGHPKVQIPHLTRLIHREWSPSREPTALLSETPTDHTSHWFFLSKVRWVDNLHCQSGIPYAVCNIRLKLKDLLMTCENNQKIYNNSLQN